jgi:hypothetical protein
VVDFNPELGLAASCRGGAGCELRTVTGAAVELEAGLEVEAVFEPEAVFELEVALELRAVVAFVLRFLEGAGCGITS